MSTRYKIAAWAAIMTDMLLILKFTWYRESLVLLVRHLKEADASRIWAYLTSSQCNLFPFRTIGFYFFHSTSIEIAVINLAGNLLAFMPIGMILPLLAGKAKPSLRMITAVSFGFSLLIEVGQLLTEVGAFDVDDLILNTLGGCLGYGLLGLIVSVYRAKSHKMQQTAAKKDGQRHPSPPTVHIT